MTFRVWYNYNMTLSRYNNYTAGCKHILRYLNFEKRDDSERFKLTSEGALSVHCFLVHSNVNRTQIGAFWLVYISPSDTRVLFHSVLGSCTMIWNLQEASTAGTKRLVKILSFLYMMLRWENNELCLVLIQCCMLLFIQVLMSAIQVSIED